MILTEIREKGLAKPPEWLDTNCCYLTIVGSFSYGISSDTSDMDLCGFAIPKKEVLFPHLVGAIRGFDLDEYEEFNQWQQHHIFDQHALKGHGRTYDITIFNIVKFFKMLVESNPNVIDSIFTNTECVVHCNYVGELVRESRHLFLHKGCFKKFKNYAFSQMHKMSSKNPVGKRKEQREKFGFDLKFAYNLVRLLNECEQILINQDLDLMANNEQLKAIRRGDVSEKDILTWATEKKLQLEKVYVESKLPESPDKVKIKQLLMNCLEHHYGNLNDCVRISDAFENALRSIKGILNSVGV